MRTKSSQRRHTWSLLAAVLGAAQLFGASGALAQDTSAGGTIVGRVTNAQSQSTQGVAGAAVQVEGTRLGAIAGQDGRYRIANVPAGTHTVLARYIGYTAERRRVTVATGEEVTANFALQPAAVSLEQIVVTGTAGGEQRRSIGNSVTSINAGEELSRSSAPDLANLINGRAPGVVVAPGSSRLGSGPEIEIRGRSSLSLASSPLLYIDGVRVNNAVRTGPENIGFGSQNASVAGRMNDISPEDIERIEIVKGPAAATLYGTEAANGVIQIITKRSATGGKPEFRVQVQEGSLWFRDAAGRVPTNVVPDESGNLVSWNGVQAEKDRGTPIFRTGQTTRYDLSLAGGRDPLRYYVASAYENDGGVEPNNSLKQFSGHANFGLSPNKALDLSTSLNYVNRSAHLGADAGASPLLGAELGHPLVFPDARGFFPNWPPELEHQLYDNAQSINRFTGSVTLDHRPLGWLSHRLIAGVDYTGEDSRGLERFAPPALAVFLPPSVAAGQINQVIRQNNVFTGDYAATAKFAVTQALSSTSSVGAQYYRTEINKSTLGGIGFPGEGVETVTGAATPITPTQDPTANTTLGAYAQQQFGWSDRLFVTGALRVDNNSAFGQGFKWVTYPKVSAAWVVSEEPFWGAALGAVNLFRLRAAYGESGRQPAAFSALRTFTPVPGPNGTTAVTPGRIGNPNLKPERGRELEAGFELGVFNQLNIDFTYFSKRTTDEIISQPVAPSGGFPGDQLRNLGRVDNHGIELQAILQASTLENFGWEIVGNIATNKDVIKSLGGLPAVIGPGQNNVVGHPILGFFAKRVVSADRDPTTNGATNVLCDGGPGQGAVTCDVAPLVYIGTPTPKLTGSVSNTFTVFKNLRLYGLVDFKRGHRLFNAVEQLRCTAAIGIGFCEANYRPEKYSPRYLAELDPVGAAGGLNHQFIQDASFVKLREVSATYTLPRWLPGTSRASLTLAARELHTWTKYGGIDPEVNYYPGISPGDTESIPLASEDQAVMPPLSRFIATLNLAF